FSKPEVLNALGAKDSAEAVEKVRERNREIEALYDECKKLAEIEEIANRVAGEVDLPAGRRMVHPEAQAPKTLGEMIVNSAAFQQYRQTRNPTAGEIRDFGLSEIKNALFETGAGWAPETTRIGVVVEAPTRPLQVIDIIPSGRTSQAAVVYMEETTRTHAAAEVAEGGLYPESEFVLTEKSSPVRKIGDSIPVTDEQLDDVEGVQSYLTARLMFGLRQRFDAQILAGNGTAPNLRG